MTLVLEVEHLSACNARLHAERRARLRSPRSSAALAPCQCLLVPHRCEQRQLGAEQPLRSAESVSLLIRQMLLMAKQLSGWRAYTALIQGNPLPFQSVGSALRSSLWQRRGKATCCRALPKLKTDRDPGSRVRLGEFSLGGPRYAECCL